ncbi:MAG: hydrolase [Gammaproteobacteria bacterium]
MRSSPRLRHASEGFKPAWWLTSPHAQTILAAFIRCRACVQLTRERLELPDGDFLDLDWTPHAPGPLVLVFHGLEGSNHSRYAMRALEVIHRHGWQGAIMYFRGCSGEINRLARSYHSGDTADMRFLFQYLKHRYPERVLAAIGFSLGGNALLKYLGEAGNASLLSSATAVSVPFELDKAARKLEAGSSRIYQWYLLRKLRAKAKAKGLASRGELKRLKTFRQFDDRITAPLHGFEGVDDYYRRASCRQYLQGVAIPTLILHAKDDPFLPPEAIPSPEEVSETVHLEISPQGGHVGFVSGKTPLRPHFWLESRILDFLKDSFSTIALTENVRTLSRSS